jgi:hypothetical protein
LQNSLQIRSVLKYHSKDWQVGIFNLWLNVCQALGRRFLKEVKNPLEWHDVEVSKNDEHFGEKL